MPSIIDSFPRRYVPRFLIFLLASNLFASGFGQGTLDVVRTGGVFPVILSRSVPTVSEQFPRIALQFGFGTDEEIQPDLFLDSVTGTIQAADSLSPVLVLFTVDRSGANFAPNSPGTISLDSQALQQRAIVYPSLQTRLLHESAYEVVFELPKSLQNRPLNLLIDLFDNENPLQSLAWLGDVTVVPEPAVAIISLATVALWFLTRRARQ